MPLRRRLTESLGPDHPILHLPLERADRPTKSFSVVRPTDLVVLDVDAVGMELRDDVDPPVLVSADDEDPLLVVWFPFQHVAEEATLAIEVTGNRSGHTTGDPGSSSTGVPADLAEPEEPPTFPVPAPRPPIRARAARGSRLVFAAPRDAAISFSSEGVLAAMASLPLVVTRAATPRVERRLPPGVDRDDLVVALPGGLGLARSGGGLVLGGLEGTEPAASLFGSAASLRMARTLMATSTVRDLRGRRSPAAAIEAVAREGPISELPSRAGIDPRLGIADVLEPFLPVLPTRPRVLRPPGELETAIEAPYRLLISPSERNGWIHATTPVAAEGEAERVELWHTRLGVRRTDRAGALREVTEAHDDAQRIVRAVWARDKDGTEPTEHDAEPTFEPFRTSLDGLDRVILVRQSAETHPRSEATGRRVDIEPEPVSVESLMLSSLGAWLDLDGRWETEPYSREKLPGILSWTHQAPMGRDQFVRVVYPGYLFPFGHKATLVKITERKIDGPVDPQARLFQRYFIVVSQPTKTYGHRGLPFVRATLEPLVTPDLDQPARAHAQLGPQELFWPAVGNPTEPANQFVWTIHATDHERRAVTFRTPLLFVAEHVHGGADATRIVNTWEGVELGVDPDVNRSLRPAGADAADGRGQRVAYAVADKPGDTAFESRSFRFAGAPEFGTSTPHLADAELVLPAMQLLAPSAPPGRVSYGATYLAKGFSKTDNEGQVFLEIADAVGLDYSSTERSGGFINPRMAVNGLSRKVGVTAGNALSRDRMTTGEFDAEQFLKDALPRLFGLFDLIDVLELAGLPLDDAPDFVSEAFSAVEGLLDDLLKLRDAVVATVHEAEKLVDTTQQRLDDAIAAGEQAAENALAVALGKAETLRDQFTDLRDTAKARVGDLHDTVTDLLSPDTVSDVDTVVARIMDPLAALGRLVRDVQTKVRALDVPPALRSRLERLVASLDPIRRVADVAQDAVGDAADLLAALESAADDATDAAADELAELVRLVRQLVRLVNGFQPENLEVRARMEWRPKLAPWTVGGTEVFSPREDGLLLLLEARATGKGEVGVDVLAELRDFAITMFPGEALLRISFERLAFIGGTKGKPEVDCVFGDLEFLGYLGFVERLRELIPFDGFSDPPFLEVSPSGVDAGFTIGLPDVAIGVFSLQNLSLTADCRIPFLGDALTVGFAFCTRERPFNLSVALLGGGGYFGMRVSPEGLEVLELSLEAGATLSLDFGVASGSLSAKLGILMRLEGDDVSLTAYFRARGEVDVLGIISASIELYLALTYDFGTGKMVGEAQLTISIDVLFFSGSVTIRTRRQFAGSNGDPTLAQAYDVQPDGTSERWDRHCLAFAPEG